MFEVRDQNDRRINLTWCGNSNMKSKEEKVCKLVGYKPGIKRKNREIYELAKELRK